ncbi:MAG: hypothetical protein ACM3PU_11250 [Gemmatimonadota bacterium]
MTDFTVAFHGVTASSEAAARSMLRLLLPMLGNRWAIGDARTSDVVILEAGALGELNRTGASRNSALYIVFDDSGDPPPNAFCVIHRPLNSARTIEVLHKAQAELERRRSGMSATTMLPAGLGSDASETDSGIHTSMRTAVRWVLQDELNAVTVLSVRDIKIFSVLPQRGFTSRLTLTELADLMRRNEPVKLVNLRDQEREALASRKRNFEPLLKLDWIFWLTGTNGDLRPELHVSKPYRLRKFPDFSRLPHYRSDVRMASLLKAEPLTVGQLAERAGVRLETACNFVNACAALGLVGSTRPRGAGHERKPADEEAHSTESVEEARSAGLLGSLRAALGLARRSPPALPRGS